MASILALIMVLLGGCDLSGQALDPEKIQQQIAVYREQEQATVRTTIADPVRAEQFLVLIGERDELIVRSTESINTYRDRMAALNANFHAERDDFETLVASFIDQREETQRRFVEIAARMKAATTADEWKEISKFQLKRLDTRQLVYAPVGTGD